MSSAITLNDVCEFIVDSEHKTAPTQKTGYPYIRTPNIGRGRLDFNNVRRVSEEAYFGWTKRAVPVSGDLILAREAPVGNVAIVPEGEKVCLGQRTVLLRPNRNLVDPEYLNYLLIGDEVQSRMHSMSSGATVAHLNMKDIRELVLPKLPLIDEQKKLAKIISSYDNLIENNNRRIAILEEIAQSLYREWFVNFRFPGHENIKYIDSPLGKIPEGWKVMSAAEAIDINPRTSLPKEGVKPFVPMTSLSESSMIIGEIEERAGNGGVKFINGDTLFARITPCLQNGKIGYVQFLTKDNPVGFGSTEFIVLREKVVSPEFIYCLARSEKFRNHAINSMAGADGRQRVKSDCFASYYLAIPDAEILNQFSRIAKSSFSQIFNLNRKNKILRLKRDMLLPKLISGGIRI